MRAQHARRAVDVEATQTQTEEREDRSVANPSLGVARTAIETMTPDVFKQKFNEGTLGLFDVIVTFSSVEHSGLGRYGDALNNRHIWDPACCSL